MHPDTFPAERPGDPADGAAVIHPVTPAMMDEAAHKAAQLADDVAHHLVPAPVQEAVHEPVHESVAAAPEPAPAHDAPATAPVALAESAEDRAAALGQAASSALVTAADAVDDGLRAATARVDAALSDAAPGRPLPGGIAALSQYQAAVLGMVQANLSATGDLVTALAGAKSLPDVMAINAEHLRRQMDAFATQGRDLAALTQKLAASALLPFAGPARAAR